MIKQAFIALLTLWALSPTAAAQVADLEPSEPEVGQIVTITYNPKAPGAKLTLDEDVYAVGDIYFLKRKSVVFKMRREGEVYQQGRRAQSAHHDPGRQTPRVQPERVCQRLCRHSGVSS